MSPKQYNPLIFQFSTYSLYKWIMEYRQCYFKCTTYGFLKQGVELYRELSQVLLELQGKKQYNENNSIVMVKKTKKKGKER